MIYHKNQLTITRDFMMPNQAIEQLANTLKVPVTELEDLSVLSETQLSQLEGLITAAQQKQRQTLNDAIENGLNYVPAILRGTVKKIVRG
jgi:molybdopterin-binding protein